MSVLVATEDDLFLLGMHYRRQRLLGAFAHPRSAAFRGEAALWDGMYSQVGVASVGYMSPCG